MKPRRIARELALIILGQLPTKSELTEGISIEHLIARSLISLTDHARVLLSDAEDELKSVSSELLDLEIEHPDNALTVHSVKEVPVTTGFIRKQVEKIDRALSLLSEAVELPEMAMHSGQSRIETTCPKCKASSTVLLDRADRSEVREFALELIDAYLKHRKEIETTVRKVKSKWRLERMVSIDRDILKLACTELYYMPDIPIRVAINEAVELCHVFADQKAAKFINGVLADLVEDASAFRETGEHLSSLDESISETESGEPVV